MGIMKFRKFILSMNESVKELSLNRILDKISKRLDLTNGEKNFLDSYGKINDRDYFMISKESVIKIIENLNKIGRKIFCNLHDRNGLIGLEIIDIDNDFQEDVCNLHLKGGEIFKLDDRFLFNITWNIDSETYSLEEHSEYFEKIPVGR